MKYLFAVNPVLGKNKAKEKMAKLAERLKEEGIDFITYETQPYQYADDLRKVIIESQATHVFAVGGDGTAHEVLNAVIGLDVFFGIVPFGSGNDFARALTLPKKIDKIVEMIKHNDYITIDVGKVEGGRYFLNYISFGFDVVVLKKSIALRKVFKGAFSYIAALFTTLIKYKCRTIKINGEDKLCYLAAIHNGKYYGGGMKLNPYAEVNDSLLNLCTVKKISRLKFVALFPSVFSGKHYRFKKIVSFQSKRQFTIDTYNDIVLTGIDGEIYELPNPVTVSVVPESVKLIRYKFN